MRLVLRFVLVFLTLTSTSAFAKTDPWFELLHEVRPEIKSVTKLLPELRTEMQVLNPGDLVVFDLDNTVFREAQTLGTDEWYTHQIAKLTSEGLSEREARFKLETDNAAIKTASRMRLMERGIPRLIADLQKRGVLVIGLTARHPNLAPSTLRHLAELGIDFDLSPRLISVPGEFQPIPDHEFLWSSGVAFTDGSPKGEILKALIARSRIRPRFAFAIDDRIHHVHSFVEAFSDLRIPAHVVHYLKALEESFDPVLADRQYAHFKETGILLSDAAVKGLLRCERKLTARVQLL